MPKRKNPTPPHPTPATLRTTMPSRTTVSTKATISPRATKRTTARAKESKINPTTAKQGIQETQETQKIQGTQRFTRMGSERRLQPNSEIGIASCRDGV